jgi:hypothetical protein
LRTDSVKFTYVCAPRPRPKLDPFISEIENRLKAETELPKCQQSTSAMIFRDLINNGYDGSYDSVRRFVQKFRSKYSKKQSKT